MPERGFWYRTAIVLIALSAVVFLFNAFGRIWDFLGDLLLIFFLAYIVGSLVIHMVNGVMRVPHMRRPVAILIVYAVLITGVAILGFLVIPTLVDQVNDVAEAAPEYIDRGPEYIAWVEGQLLRAGVDLDIQNRVQLESLSELADDAVLLAADNAGRILQGLVSIIFATSLVIVISFYIVLDGGRRLYESLKVLPPAAEQEARYVLRTIDDTFYGYVRGMLLISLIYGVGTAAVMTWTGLPAALPVALVSSVLLAVPFVGDWLALILPLTVAAVAGDFITLITVAAVLLFIQQVMLNLLTPRILGHAVRMPAMLVIVAVVLGARLAGISGALLAVPTMGVIHGLAVHYGMRIRQRREERERAASEEREEAAREAAEAEAALAAEEASANGDPGERIAPVWSEQGMPPC